MRTSTTVFYLEVYRHRWLVMATLPLGCLPYLAQSLPNPTSAEDLAMVISIPVLTGGTLVAIFLGARLFVPEVREGRLGCFLHRPLPTWQIWVGKVAAATCVTWLVMAFLALPSAPLAGGWLQVTALLSPAVLLNILYFLALSHALAMALAARSPWFLLDLLLGGVVLTLLVKNPQFYPTAVAEPTWTQLYWLPPFQQVLLALATGALLFGSLVQLCRSGVDLRRGYRILSLTAWGALLPTALGLHLYAASLEPPPLNRLSYAQGMPQGPWMFIAGLGHHGAHTAFFLHSRSRERIYLRGHPAAPPVYDFASGRVAWIEDPYVGGPLTLRSALLRRDGASSPQTLPWSIPLAGLSREVHRQRPAAFALGELGQRAAVWVDGRLQVISDGHGTPLAEVEVSAREVALDFWNARHLMVYAARGGDGEAPFLEILGLDIQQKRLRSIARYEGVADLRALRLSAQRWSNPAWRIGRFVLRHSERGEVALHSKKGGALLAWLGVGTDPASAVVLTESTLAVVAGVNAAKVVHFFDQEGTPLRQVPVGPCYGGQLTAGPARGAVILGCHDGVRTVDSSGQIGALRRSLRALPYRHPEAGTEAPPMPLLHLAPAPREKTEANDIFVDPEKGLINNPSRGQWGAPRPILPVATLPDALIGGAL